MNKSQTRKIKKNCSKEVSKKRKKGLAKFADEKQIKNTLEPTKDIFCPVCEEQYTEPSGKDWIEWYEGGLFFCYIYSDCHFL